MNFKFVSINNYKFWSLFWFSSLNFYYFSCTLLLHKTYGEYKANELRNKGLTEHEIVLQLDKTLNDEQKIAKYNVIGPFCREFFKEENEVFQSRYSGLPRIIEI